MSDAERRCATVSNSCRPLSINSGRQPTGNLSTPLDVLPTPHLASLPIQTKTKLTMFRNQVRTSPDSTPDDEDHHHHHHSETRAPVCLELVSRVIESKFNLGCRFPPSWPTSRHPTPPAHHHTNHVHRLVGVASRRLYRPPRSVPDSPPRFFVRSSHSAFRSQSHPDSTTRTW